MVTQLVSIGALFKLIVVNFSNYNFRNNLNNTLAVNCQIKSLKPKIHRKGEDRVLQKNISHKNPVILAHQKIEDDLKNMKE